MLKKKSTTTKKKEKKPNSYWITELNVKLKNCKTSRRRHRRNLLQSWVREEFLRWDTKKKMQKDKLINFNPQNEKLLFFERYC